MSGIIFKYSTPEQTSAKGTNISDFVSGPSSLMYVAQAMLSLQLSIHAWSTFWFKWNNFIQSVRQLN